MLNRFRVLIIDDEPEVIKRLPEHVHIEKRSFEGKNFIIDLRLVNVKIENSNGQFFQISNSTLEEISSACSEPPDLILADYGYAKPETIAALRALSQQGKEITEQDLVGKVLNTSDLATASKLFSIDVRNDSYKRNSILNNFLELKAKFYLYSYTSKDFYKSLGEISARVNRTQSAFPIVK